MSASAIGKLLLAAAAIIAGVGGLLLLLGGTGVRLPLGRLPGDLSWRRGNTRLYVPLATSLLLSALLTLILNIIVRRR
jgi:hypothetical protein